MRTLILDVDISPITSPISALVWGQVPSLAAFYGEIEDDEEIDWGDDE